MIRKIIRIDPEKCNSCGECVAACHEGAIGMENGKAVLLRDDYCDGLGDCLPVCRAGAISFEERDALPYDEKAVLSSAKSRTFRKMPPGYLKDLRPAPRPVRKTDRMDRERTSCLGQWPVQIKLTSANAAFFGDADILVAADCCAYAYGEFHQQLMRGRVTLIGCPKLDGVDYTVKLAEIFGGNAIRSVTVARMSVPCCGGMEQAVKRAIRESGKRLPCRAAVISPQGKLDYEPGSEEHSLESAD